MPEDAKGSEMLNLSDTQRSMLHAAAGAKIAFFYRLPKWARQSLEGSVAASDAPVAGAPAAPKPARPLLRPGGQLVRDWHSRTHTVVVLDAAFEVEGRRYRSLTQIAREITSACWSGPRFFGLSAPDAAGPIGREGVSRATSLVAQPLLTSPAVARASIPRVG